MSLPDDICLVVAELDSRSKAGASTSSFSIFATPPSKPMSSLIRDPPERGMSHPSRRGHVCLLVAAPYWESPSSPSTLVSVDVAPSFHQFCKTFESDAVQSQGRGPRVNGGLWSFKIDKQQTHVIHSRPRGKKKEKRVGNASEGTKVAKRGTRTV